MSKNDVILKDSIVDIKVDAKSSDIMLFSDEIEEPLIKCSGHFDIIEKDGKATIIENFENNIDASTKIMLNDGSIIQSNSDISITYKRGIAVVDSFTLSKEPITKNFIEIIMPKKSKKLNLMLETTTGNITIEKLMLSKLIIKTLSGNVNLTDIDVLLANIKTESGDVNMEILESALNYKLFLKSIGARVQDEISDIYPSLLNEKHELILDSLTGNVNVLFKGKKFIRR